MNSGDYGDLYLWQAKNWPNFHYKLELLATNLADVCLSQGTLLGRLADIGLDIREQASVNVLTEEVITTSAIEGENLNLETVRSSIARQLGVDIGGLAPVDRHVEGVVAMVLDATTNAQEILTHKRLFGWHAALFPTGYSGLSPIQVGGYRDDKAGPMQVVSGPIGRRKVHFEAPPAAQLNAQMNEFIDWLNTSTEDHPIIKAGLAHLWFVTLHPFDDGNGRIGRAIGDLLLARADGSQQRFYSLSAQIQRERRHYYDILERSQKGSLDVTLWLKWFLENLGKSLNLAQQGLDTVLIKTRFWQKWINTTFNDRQRKILNRLLDGFEGKLNTSKWATIAKCSSDTALRDINELVELGILCKSAAKGRSTTYELQL